MPAPTIRCELTREGSLLTVKNVQTGNSLSLDEGMIQSPNNQRFLRRLCVRGCVKVVKSLTLDEMRYFKVLVEDQEKKLLVQS